MAGQGVPESRIRLIAPNEVDPAGNFILYWMTAQRRFNSNFALQRACEWSRQLKKPLVVLEPLNCDYRWACDRFHAFVIQGMLDHLEQASKLPLTYLPYVEPEPKAGTGLLHSLASQACAVVTDDFPCFFHPALLRVAKSIIPCRFEAVDSNGLMPLSQSDRAFARAFDFRRFLQRTLAPHLSQTPLDQPWRGLEKIATWEPDRSLRRWKFLEPNASLDAILKALPIDHKVGVSRFRGGPVAAQSRLKSFIATQLKAYSEDRNNASLDATSGLSSYLHFGHISTHQILDAVVAGTGWNPSQVSTKATGSSEGWWNLEQSSESFLDELVTWRELGFHFSHHRRDYARYDSLPEWAQQTLGEHEKDRRDYVYTLEEFDQSLTHDELWNAAQRQLVREGRIHNYLRMLWGKKIVEWTLNSRDALSVMIELNNKYALDGRDPNSYSGIFWVLGRFDRAWGPEREIFGMIRYMSSDNTRRKMPVQPYLQKYARNPISGSLFD